MSPDVLVVRGIEPHDRQNYLLWEEGCPPQVVIEVTSESTRDEDLYDKFVSCNGYSNSASRNWQENGGRKMNTGFRVFMSPILV